MMSMDLLAEQALITRPEKPAVELEPCAILYHEREPGLQLFLIEDGAIELVCEGPAGERVVRELGPGDLVGLESLTDLGPRAATARARTHSRLIALDPPLLEAVVRARPDVALGLLGRLARQLRQVEDAAAPPPATALCARLVHEESGTEYILRDQFANTIGRHDGSTGIAPTIDLAPLDKQRSISRHHARILWWQGRLLLAEEERVTNGTYINGERVDSGAASELEGGDELRFGLVRLRLEEG